MAHGFSDTAFWILYLLCKEERTYTQNDLADELCIAKQTVNSAIAKLVKEGYVELIPSKGLRRKPLPEYSDAWASESKDECLKAMGSFGGMCPARNKNLDGVGDVRFVWKLIEMEKRSSWMLQSVQICWRI